MRHDFKRQWYLWTWLIAIVVVVGAIVALNWQWFNLAAAFALAERRPALLADAEWNEPASARRFLTAFRRGTNEEDLLRWLESNKFTVDHEAGRATRLISSLPCAEWVEVKWSEAPSGVISSVEARVSEAGCL